MKEFKSNNYIICKTARLEVESILDNVSITHVVERLDIETMLKRAQSGILDLRTYQRPMVADAVGTSDSEQAAIAAQMLDAPDTPMNHIFGVDLETANKTLANLQQVARAGSKPIKKDEPTPGKDEPIIGKDEPTKGED